GDPAAHRLLLFGHVDDTHSPLAKALQELVRPDARAGAFARLPDAGVPRPRVRGRRRDSLYRLVSGGGALADDGLLQKAAGVLMRLEQGFHPGPQGGVTGASLLQKGGPLRRVRLCQSGGEDAFFGHGNTCAASGWKLSRRGRSTERLLLQL